MPDPDPLDRLAAASPAHRMRQEAADGLDRVVELIDDGVMVARAAQRAHLAGAAYALRAQPWHLPPPSSV